VPNAYGSLRRVLVHRPGRELDCVTPETVAEFNFARPVDRVRFLAEYDAMTTCFTTRGVELVQLAEVLAADREALDYLARRPNMTYTRDLASMFRTGAVLMSPHLSGRRGDELVIGRAFERLGVPVLGRIGQPGFLEGGGVTMIGDDTVVASLCDRANREGTGQLRRLVHGPEAPFFLEVPLPQGHIHIDGIFLVLGPDLCLIHEPPFRERPCLLYQAGAATPREVMFLDYLDERGMRRVPIDRAERDRGHLNLVVVEQGRRAVGFAEATRLRATLATMGWTIDGFPSEELFVGRGGAHCMTCPIAVD
jgi:N-dimethylarginine dimethylaminohydrolase